MIRNNIAYLIKLCSVFGNMHFRHWTEFQGRRAICIQVLYLWMRKQHTSLYTNIPTRSLSTFWKMNNGDKPQLFLFVEDQTSTAAL